MELSEIDREIRELQSLASAIDDGFKITCLGLYNGGKSSLLNALTHSYNNANFRVADIVETKETKAIRLNDCIYVDTPGLNATTFDDDVALKAARHSDLNLFVHNIGTGDLQIAEKKFLEYIAKHWENHNSFLQSSIFVLSRKDEASDDDTRKVKITIESQLKGIFHKATWNPYICAVSANSYMKGKRENKATLVKNSNVDNLIALIQKRKEKLQSINRDMRIKKIKKQKDRLIARINSQIDRLRGQTHDIDYKRDTMRQEIDQAIQKANNDLANM